MGEAFGWWEEMSDERNGVVCKYMYNEILSVYIQWFCSIAFLPFQVFQRKETGRDTS